MEFQEPVFYSRMGRETNFGIAGNTNTLSQLAPGTIFPSGKPARSSIWPLSPFSAKVQQHVKVFYSSPLRVVIVPSIMNQRP